MTAPVGCRGDSGTTTRRPRGEAKSQFFVGTKTTDNERSVRIAQPNKRRNHECLHPATGKQSQGLADNAIHLDYLRHVAGANENLGKLLGRRKRGQEAVVHRVASDLYVSGGQESQLLVGQRPVGHPALLAPSNLRTQIRENCLSDARIQGPQFHT